MPPKTQGMEALCRALRARAVTKERANYIGANFYLILEKMLSFVGSFDRAYADNAKSIVDGLRDEKGNFGFDGAISVLELLQEGFKKCDEHTDELKRLSAEKNNSPVVGPLEASGGEVIDLTGASDAGTINSKTKDSARLAEEGPILAEEIDGLCIGETLSAEEGVARRVREAEAKGDVINLSDDSDAGAQEEGLGLSNGKSDDVIDLT